MADATSGADHEGQVQIVPSHSSPVPPAVTHNNEAEHAGGGILAQALGMLGLLEVWVFIVYVLGGDGFTDFEEFMLGILAAFEFLGRLPGALAMCLICNNGSDMDQAENLKTATRDQFHNMVYPRSAPRSRKRRDFAAMAWYSLWFASIPMVLLLTFFPVWGFSSEEDPLGVRLVPSILAVLATVESVVFSMSMGCNQSCFVLTVLYAHTKIISLFILANGADRLLLGEEGGLVAALGIPLACLQVVKIASACVAAVNYVRGRPDERLPQLRGAFRLCCFSQA